MILDVLADLMTGDENSKQDTQPVFNALRRISEQSGAAIIVIHHANKMGGHRGSSVIKDAPDILLQVSLRGRERPGHLQDREEPQGQGAAVLPAGGLVGGQLLRGECGCAGEEGGI